MNEYGVVLFYTSSSAMRAEKVLRQNGLAVKLIPTPRELSSDCGVALRFNCSDIEDINLFLAQFRIEFQSVHLM
jgi:hypothetical protein